jgi:hypothetical protein
MSFSPPSVAVFLDPGRSAKRKTPLVGPSRRAQEREHGKDPAVVVVVGRACGPS